MRWLIQNNIRTVNCNFHHFLFHFRFIFIFIYFHICHIVVLLYLFSCSTIRGRHTLADHDFFSSLTCSLELTVSSSYNYLRHWGKKARQRGRNNWHLKNIQPQKLFIKCLLLSSQEYSWLLCTALTYKNKRKTIWNIVFHLLVIIFFFFFRNKMIGEVCCFKLIYNHFNNRN